jgi:hypothetical protein
MARLEMKVFISFFYLFIYILFSFMLLSISVIYLSCFIFNLCHFWLVCMEYNLFTPFDCILLSKHHHYYKGMYEDQLMSLRQPLIYKNNYDFHGNKSENFDFSNDNENHGKMYDNNHVERRSNHEQNGDHYSGI